MAALEGYRVMTIEGKTVGRVAGESESTLLVQSGLWPRKSWRALPRRYASIDKERGSVLIQVSGEILRKSPKLKRGAPVDERAVAAWWSLD
jgi:hypothetical protein